MPKIAADIVDCYPFRRTPGTIEFLMLQRAPDLYLGGTWHAVSGRVETGETAWAAALRELREETDVRPVRFWQLEAINTFYMAVRDSILMCPAFAAELAVAAEVVLSPEHTAHRWVPAPAAPAAFFWPGQQAAVREILELIIPGGPQADALEIALPAADASQEVTSISKNHAANLKQQALPGRTRGERFRP